MKYLLNYRYVPEDLLFYFLDLKKDAPGNHRDQYAF